MQTQTVENCKDLKCARLVSPREEYDRLLVHLYEEFDENQIKLFGFWLRSNLPSSILEVPDLLNWFRQLEYREKLSWRKVDYLSKFLRVVSHNQLLTEVLNYQTRIKIIEFFLKNLQQKLPDLYLGRELNEEWSELEEELVLPQQFLIRCKELLCSEQECDVRRLFSKGFYVLAHSCHSCNDDVQSARCKLLYLANLFYNRFKEAVTKNEQILKFEPLPVVDGECFCGNHERTPVCHGRQSSVRHEVQQQSSCGPRETPITVHVHASVTVDLSFGLGLLVGAFSIGIE